MALKRRTALHYTAVESSPEIPEERKPTLRLPARIRQPAFRWLADCALKWPSPVSGDAVFGRGGSHPAYPCAHMSGFMAHLDQRQRQLQAVSAANRALHSKTLSMPAALPAAGRPNRAGAQTHDRGGQPIYATTELVFCMSRANR